jgi:hypothetical protein
VSDHDKKLIHNSSAEFLTFHAQAGEQSIAARYADEAIELRPLPISSKGAQA